MRILSPFTVMTAPLLRPASCLLRSMSHERDALFGRDIRQPDHS